MSTRFRSVTRSLHLSHKRVFSVGLATTALLAAWPSFAADWQARVNYGGNTVMDLYVPDTVDASPGIVVSLHYCSGNSSSARPWFKSAADQYGFIIIAPSAGGNCFDASPSRSGERDAITKMVAYVVTNNKADPTKVFAAGASSGACMTNALLAAYPEVFAGGSVLAGVPAGAWTGGNNYGWTTPANRSAQEWGEIVRKADPGFAGPWPRVQLWHGSADNTLNYMPNFPAEVAQWTNVHGVSDANATQETFKGSQDSWARISYKSASGTVVLETNVAQGAPHDLSGRGLWNDAVRFFGLDKDTPSGGTGGAGGAASGGGSAGGAGGGPNGGTSGSATAGKSGSTGGSATSGGAATGGQSTTGGSASGGTSSGGTTTSTGGVPTGGTSTSTGGTSSGGQPATTGGTGVGGAKGGAGGGLPAAPASPPPDDGGCSIHGTGNHRGPLGVLAGLGAAGLGMLIRRRRRTAR